MANEAAVYKRVSGMRAAGFHDQFVISHGPRTHPVDYQIADISGWFLASAPSLPVTPVSVEGKEVGWILGWAVTPAGEMVHSESHVALPPGGVEDFMYSLSGRWAAVLVHLGRIYLDPAGSLALVYSGEEKAVASTVSLLYWGVLSKSGRSRRPPLSPNHFYPAGLTSDPGVRRLLPNHYLDLTSWHTERHWGPPSHRVDAAGIERDIGTVLAHTRSAIVALSTSAPLLLPLTAGRDSRMVMAAARPVLERCEFVTFDYRDSRRTDVTYGRAVASRFGLRHWVLPLESSTTEEKESYLRAVGYDANAGKARDFLVAAGRLPRDHGWITGFAGEVGRGYYWNNANERLDARELIVRMKLQQSEDNVAAVQEWLNGIPCVDGEALLDLLYIEQRLGCWASPQLYGTAPFEFNVMPMNSRAVFSAMLSLPIKYRRDQVLARDVVRAGWSELADLPFGRAPGVWGRIDSGLAFSRKVGEQARLRVAKLGRRAE